jgi:hypothetical protein
MIASIDFSNITLLKQLVDNFAKSSMASSTLKNTRPGVGGGGGGGGGGNLRGRFRGLKTD